MSYEIKQSSTAYPLMFLMVDSSDHVSAKTGLSPTVTLSKSGGSFASPSGSVSEVGSGWYKVAGNATDSGTLGPLVLHATGTGADPVDVIYRVVAHDVQDAVHLGLSSLPNVACDSDGGLIVIGTGTRQVNPNAGGVPLTTGARQAVWDVLTSSQSASGSIGKAIADNLTGNAYTIVNSGTYGNSALNTLLGTIAGYIDTEVAAIKAKTDNLPSSFPANFSSLAIAATGQVGLNFDDIKDASGSHTLTNITIPTVTTAVNVTNNNDKSGYTLSSAYDPAKTAAQAGDAMALTSAYDAAKTAAQPGDDMGIANGAISDASFTEPTIGANTLATGPIGRILQSWRADHYKETFDAGTGDLKRYASNGSTVLLVLPCTDTLGVQTRGAAS